MDILSILGGLWRLLLDPVTLLYVVIGAQAGILFGMMPGLTTTTALSLLTGLTFSLAPEKAIAVVLGAYVGSVTGGSRSAILINIPGTPAQAAVCLELLACFRGALFHGCKAVVARLGRHASRAYGRVKRAGCRGKSRPSLLVLRIGVIPAAKPDEHHNYDNDCRSD